LDKERTAKWLVGQIVAHELAKRGSISPPSPHPKTAG
jgi:hypothetical protein